MLIVRSFMKRLISFFIYFVLFIFATLLISQKSYASNPVATQSALVATTPGSDTAPADGVTIASMTATLKDFQGFPATGDAVALSAPSDPTAKFSPSSVTLNAQGIATFSATSTQAGTDPITVTDLTTSTQLVALGNIVFTAVSSPTPTLTPTSGPSPTPTPQPNICSGSSSDPPDAPNLYQITSTLDNATLYFSPPQKTYTGFIISYGLTLSADSYATQFSQSSSPGAISYTINSLNSNQTYYFKVRGVNQCAFGDWSQVVRTFTADPNSPTATPSGSLIMGAGASILPVILSVAGILVLAGASMVVFF
jgi:hypothetical protein